MMSWSVLHVSFEVSWKGSQPARMPYAGIAAELTNDGRLRTDWWAPEGTAGKSICHGHDLS